MGGWSGSERGIPGTAPAADEQLLAVQHGPPQRPSSPLPPAPYQALEAVDASPELPSGYSGAILLGASFHRSGVG